MIDLGLEEPIHDLKIENFDLVLFDELNQIIQNLTIRLKFILGEWFLDITQGIDYFESFFIKAPNLIQIDSMLKNEIVNTRGIQEITSYESDYIANRRTFTVKFSALAISGEEILKQMELPV